MESLCGSAVLSGRIEPRLARRPTNSSSLVRSAATFRFWRGSVSSPQRRGRKLQVLAPEASGDSGEYNGAPTNGLSFLVEDDPPLLEKDIVQNGGHRMSEKMKMATPVAVGSGTTGKKAGLFRAPIAGGVQSATAVHDLPRPALAVRNLMEQAKFGQLCTIMSKMHNHRAGYPVGSLIDFVQDSMGHPIFSLSPLAIHTRNLLENSKCSLIVQIPGGSSLSNARVTIFGDVFPLPADQQGWARQQFIKNHQQCGSQQWGNFCYYRMQNVSDIYFIGGFGTVAWVDVKEYEALKPDKVAVDGGQQNLKELNAIFSKPLKDMLSTEAEIDDAVFVSIDCKGTDVRVRQGTQFNIQRIPFEVEHEVQTLDDAKAALEKIINRHCSSNSQNGS